MRKEDAEFMCICINRSALSLEAPVRTIIPMLCLPEKSSLLCGQLPNGLIFIGCMINEVVRY